MALIRVVRRGRLFERMLRLCFYFGRCLLGPLILILALSAGVPDRSVSTANRIGMFIVPAVVGLGILLSLQALNRRLPVMIYREEIRLASCLGAGLFAFVSGVFLAPIAFAGGIGIGGVFLLAAWMLCLALLSITFFDTSGMPGWWQTRFGYRSFFHFLCRPEDCDNLRDAGRMAALRGVLVLSGFAVGAASLILIGELVSLRMG